MNVLTVPTKLIATNPLNIRRSVGDVTELAASIKELGLLEPLVVAPAAKTDKGAPAQPYILLAGHRRLAALKEAKVTEAICIVKDITDPAGQIEAMLVENLQRQDITPVEEAQAYKQLLAFDGVKVADIAKKTGRAQATVKARLALAKLPDPVQDKVHSGDVTLTDAMALSEFADDPNALSQLENALGTYNFPHMVHRLRMVREDAARAKKARADLEKAGVTVVDEPRNFHYDSTREKPLTSVISDWWATDPEARQALVDGHAVCPGHAAFVRVNGQVTFICLDPVTHHPDRYGDDVNLELDGDEPADGLDLNDPAGRARWHVARELEYDPNALTDEQNTEITELLAERQRIKDVFAAAAQVRADHVESLVAPGHKPPTGALALWVAWSMANDYGTQELRDLGLEVPEELDEAGYEATETWILGTVTGLKPDDLARLLIRDLQRRFKGLDRPDFYRWHDTDTAYWFKFLTDSGYPITPEEQAALAPKDPEQ